MDAIIAGAAAVTLVVLISATHLGLSRWRPGISWRVSVVATVAWLCALGVLIAVLE